MTSSFVHEFNIKFDFLTLTICMFNSAELNVKAISGTHFKKILKKSITKVTFIF